MNSIKSTPKVGDKFGRLTITNAIHRDGRRWFVCACECGGQAIVSRSNLPRTSSCGCVAREHGARIGRAARKHGHAAGSSRRPSPTYNSWRGMRDRCTNPKSINWQYYGGRGIGICERWQGREGFLHFLEDMGERPEGLTLDRIDPDGNYEAGNCRWATAQEQTDNRRLKAGAGHG